MFIHPRFLRRSRLLESLSLALLGTLTACDKKPAPEAAASAAAAPAASASESKKEAGPLKVAFAYVGPVGDAGWTFAHDKAAKKPRRPSLAK